MATMPPDPSDGEKKYNNSSDQEGKGQWSASTESKSPLASFGFFKNLTEKKTTRDGQPPKRRGPKPDSKPALTRRQELNRQAQRTHRERKEMYIKALEQEVLRLKELFTNSSRERDAIAEENRRLKELLMAHGIAYDLTGSNNGLGISNMGSSTYGGSSSGSVSGYNPGTNSTGYTSPPSAPRGSVSGPSGHSLSPPIQPQQQPQVPHPTGMDYDQLGIDFVLTLERPCMDHIQMLLVRAHAPDAALDTVAGHTLMATCPPPSHFLAHPETPYPHQMPPDVGTPDLMKLLDLSSRLPLDSAGGEVTPIMAWAMVLGHQRCAELDEGDVRGLKELLVGKIRCYGFGAVLEEFEVRDALMTVFAGKGNGGHGR